MRYLHIILFAVTLSLGAGCASRVERAYAESKRFPFEQRGEYFVLMAKTGKLTYKEGADLYVDWFLEDEARKKEAKLLAGMTPSERALYRQNQQIMANQKALADSQRELQLQQTLTSIDVASQQRQTYQQNVQMQNQQIQQNFQNLRSPTYTPPPMTYHNPYAR